MLDQKHIRQIIDTIYKHHGCNNYAFQIIGSLLHPPNRQTRKCFDHQRWSLTIDGGFSTNEYKQLQNRQRIIRTRIYAPTAACYASSALMTRAIDLEWRRQQ